MPYPELREVWVQMMEDCYLLRSENYDCTGKRDVQVCGEWHDPEAFIGWALSQGWKEGTGQSLKRARGCHDFDEFRCWINEEGEEWEE